jgi:phospholipid/cholesterol/gamma-HCH transport system substrate-binding protein
MESNANYTIVGVFVLSLVACIILSIIWLSSGFSKADFKIYEIFMKESVSGLSLDAPVEYNGVSVGTVTSIMINHENPQLVEVLLKIKNTTPITKGTTAKLAARSLSGIAYILLEDKGSDRARLVATPQQPYPVINTAPSLFFRLDSALTQLIASSQKLSISVQTLLTTANIESFKQILTSSENTLRLFETQTIPITNRAINNLDNMTRDLAGLATEIKRNPTVLIRGKSEGNLGPGEH